MQPAKHQPPPRLAEAGHRGIGQRYRVGLIHFHPLGGNAPQPCLAVDLLPSCPGSFLVTNAGQDQEAQPPLSVVVQIKLCHQRRHLPPRQRSMRLYLGSFAAPAPGMTAPRGRYSERPRKKAGIMPQCRLSRLAGQCYSDGAPADVWSAPPPASFIQPGMQRSKTQWLKSKSPIRSSRWTATR